MNNPGKNRLNIGVLTVVSVLLIGSAGVRLASGTGAAIAREVQSQPDLPNARPMEVAAIQEAGLKQMYDDLVAREAAVAEQEELLAARLTELNQAELAISEQLAQLEQAEASLRETLALAENASETDLTQLTTVYENMKPKEAAELFEEMSPEFAAGFIGRMRPEAAAGILAGLSPQAAYSISAVMAGRHMDVPTQ